MSVFSYSIRKYFTFSKNEIWGILLSIIILSIITGIDDGKEQFIWIQWLNNFISILLLMSLIMIVFVTSKKLLALKRGFSCEYKPWLLGLFFGLIVALVSKGKIWYFLVPGGFALHHIVKLRIGKYKPQGSFLEMAMIGLIGPLSVLTLAILFKMAGAFSTTNLFFEKAMIICCVFAVANALPIPPLDGSHMFYVSRKSYIFFFFFFLATALLMFFFNIIISIIAAMILGAIMMVLFTITIER